MPLPAVAALVPVQIQAYHGESGAREVQGGGHCNCCAVSLAGDELCCGEQRLLGSLLGGDPWCGERRLAIRILDGELWCGER